MKFAQFNNSEINIKDCDVYRFRSGVATVTWELQAFPRWFTNFRLELIME